MDDKFKRILRAMESAPSPEGMKERVFIRLDLEDDAVLNPVQRFMYTNPLKAAGLIAVTVSGLLWAALGSYYPALVTSLLSVR